MKRILWVVLGVVVALGIGFWAVRMRQKPAPVAAELVPASSLLFVDVPEFPATCVALTNTEAYALWQEPEIQAALAEPLRAFRQALGGKPDDTAIDESIGAALGAIRGEVFLAVTRFAALPKVQVGVVLGADLKENLLQARVTMAYQERRLAKYNPGLRVSKGTHLGINYRGWHMDRWHIHHAFLNTMLVVAFDEDTLRDVITRFRRGASKDEPSLAENPVFPRRNSQAGHLVAFLNVEQITQLAGPLLMMSGQTNGSALGKLARIQAVTLDTTIRDRQVQDRGVIQYSSPEPQPATATARRTFALTTPATMLYAVQPAAWGAGYQEALDSLALTGNPMFVSKAQQFERGLRRQQIRPREDFFEFLGPETAVLATWRPGAQFPEVTLAVEMRDGARPRLNAVMNALKEVALGTGTEANWEVVTAGEQTLHVLRLGAGLVAPTYFVADNFLILTSSADSAKELAAQWREPRTTLAAQPGYQQLSPALPSNPQELMYLDLPALARSLWPRVRAEGWPHTETIARHLTPYASATVNFPDKSLTTTLSTFGKPVTIAAGLAGIVAAAQPHLAALRPPPTPAAP